jgi:hypothetical protein
VKGYWLVGVGLGLPPLCFPLGEVVLYVRGRGFHVLPFFVVSFSFVCLFEFAGLSSYVPGRDIYLSFFVCVRVIQVE